MRPFWRSPNEVHYDSYDVDRDQWLLECANEILELCGPDIVPYLLESVDRPAIQLLGMSAAAARLRVHPFTLRRWCEKGKLTPIRDSTGRRLFLAELIEALARERQLRRHDFHGFCARKQSGGSQ
jgi:hypothetical protein